jgi:uncharacterized MAPEG superfamily protein
MWLYPLPGVISILGWLYILSTAAMKSLVFAVGVLVLGSAIFLVRSKIRKEWPFTTE